MYSELSDDDKEMYLDVLREAPILPFSNFVSRGDIPCLLYTSPSPRDRS